MVDQIIRPANLPRRSNPVASEIVPVDNSVEVAGSTIQEMVEAGRPTANQSESEAGVNSSKSMAPVNVKQAIDFQVPAKIDAAIGALNLGTAAQRNADEFATAAQGGKADTAVQPIDIVAIPIVFESYAVAALAASSLQNLQLIEVSEDETRGGVRTRYNVNGGSLIFDSIVTWPMADRNAAESGLSSDLVISPLGVRQSMATAAPVNVMDFGAIADGQVHPLSERFSTLSEARLIYPHAFSLTDSTDWAAIQMAIDVAASLGRDVGFPATTSSYVCNRPVVICGYPQVDGTYAYDPSYGYPRRDKQPGNIVAMNGGGSGESTGTKPTIRFVNNGLVTDDWPSTAKSIYDPTFPIKVGFIATRRNSNSELGGWTLGKFIGLNIIPPANGIGVLSANGSNKGTRDMLFSAGGRYSWISCNDRAVDFAQTLVQGHKRAGIGLLHLTDKVIEIWNSGGYFNDGVTFDGVRFSTGTRFADIEDHGSQSEAIRDLKGCSHTNGAVFGYIGRKNVQPRINAWYENIAYPVVVLGSDTEILPGTNIFDGILPEGNAGISTSQFPGGYGLGLRVDGAHFKNGGSNPTKAAITHDGYGNAVVGPNTIDGGEIYLRRKRTSVGGGIYDFGAAITGQNPVEYYNGPRQAYFRNSEISSQALGAPQGVQVPMSFGRGIVASSLTGGSVVNPIQASSVDGEFSFTMVQAAGGVTARLEGFAVGLWKITMAWASPDGRPIAGAEAMLTIGSSQSTPTVEARDRIWCETSKFELIRMPGSASTDFTEQPEISIWPRTASQARGELGTGVAPHIDITFRGLVSGGRGQIMVKALFVGEIDYDSPIKIVSVPNPSDIAAFGPTLSFGSTAPSAGEWRTGSVRYNTVPVAEGKIGWVCVTGGAPGTWKAFGNIDA